MIWITTVMFKSNDILCKQTALKATRLGERPCRCHDDCSFWPDRGTKTCGIPSFGRTSSSESGAPASVSHLIPLLDSMNERTPCDELRRSTTILAPAVSTQPINSAFSRPRLLNSD
ncbi:uncharacterized protein LOC119272114 [Triticum dicoccoides]|uniref:uncharacterized protein LOC119272114 n=1 Tax=Triticum dicoccoides TaxID=85692 RepID=UPI00188E248A|nr:uncharacterized protein LOC119272114 [Triticum dicoccoides]